MLTTILRIRLEAGLAQWQVAQQAGIRAPRLSEIERERVLPTPDELTRLALALGVEVQALEEVRDDSRDARPATASRGGGRVTSLTPGQTTGPTGASAKGKSV